MGGKRVTKKQSFDDLILLHQYAIYSAIWTLETYCRKRQVGGETWLQIASEDRQTAPMIEHAMMVLETAPEVTILRDEPRYPNVKIVYDRSGNRFFKEPDKR